MLGDIRNFVGDVGWIIQDWKVVMSVIDFKYFNKADEANMVKCEWL